MRAALFEAKMAIKRYFRLGSLSNQFFGLAFLMKK
jgi:hypothetical protein